nr:AMP-binding protein [Eoetvoesiella caeni]
MAGRPSTRYDELANTPVTQQVAQAHEAVKPDTVAKFLFTSGSTKLPKAVINTHGMLTCNQQMFLQCYPFLTGQPPVLVDWMPWHHTGAGNHNFGLVLYHGGSLYIDEGKPTVDGMAQTISNLKEVAPTIYYSVPKGLEMLAQAMKTDLALRDRFFSRLCNLFPQGAAMSAPLKHTLDELAVASCGMRIPMTASLGMTETAPFALSAHLPDWQAGIIGTPPPGLDVKLVPQGDKLEVRYRGPSIMPGYWRQPELTAEAFDDEGFLCSGDAARFVDDNAREQGLRYDGRIAEDFKLASGTWVNVGALRQRVIAAGAPHIHDIVLTGHDRDELGMLIFLLPTASSLATHTAPNAGAAAIAGDPGVQAWAQSLLDSLAENSAGSSQFIGRAMVLRDPPLMDLGEMTDKGSINQRSVLKTRAALVEQLYAAEPGSGTLLVRRSRIPAV